MRRTSTFISLLKKKKNCENCVNIVNLLCCIVIILYCWNVVVAKPITNGRVMNGGITDSKINITSNPLAGLDPVEDALQPKVSTRESCNRCFQFPGERLDKTAALSIISPGNDSSTRNPINLNGRHLSISPPVRPRLTPRLKHPLH